MIQRQRPPSSRCSCRSLLGIVLLVLLLQVVPAARDEALLKARLTESLVIVNQTRAIQLLASKLSAELGRENHLALFGAQARTAARAVLGELTDGAGCLQWDPTEPVSSGQWVLSPSQVQAAVGNAYQAVASRGGTDVVVVVEHMEKLNCDNIMYLNHLMAAMDRPDESFAPPTFLFLFEKDVAHRDYIDGGIRSYWLEAIDKECRPGPALNLRAFFGRLTHITFEALPPGTALDSQPLCSTLPRSRGGLWGLGWPFGSGGKEGSSLTSRILAVAAVGLVVVGAATYAVTRATTSQRNHRAATKPSSSDAAAAAATLAAVGTMEEDPDKVLATLTSARGGNKATGAKTTRRRSASPSPVAVVTDDGVAANGGSKRSTRASTGGNTKASSSSSSSSRRTPNAKRD